MNPKTTKEMISVDCDSSQKIIESSFAHSRDRIPTGQSAVKMHQYFDGFFIQVTWPIWSRPARLAGVRALLAREELSEESPSKTAFESNCIAGISRAGRISVGKFFNIEQARASFEQVSAPLTREPIASSILVQRTR
jgi:hypothetical protein